jgi:uncharacterized protein YceH (UPF0502 family)
MFDPNMLTYERMPLESISEINNCVGKNYDGDLLFRYDASQWANMNTLVHNVSDLNNRLIGIETTTTDHILTVETSLEYSIEQLRQENYELQQRLDRLEMMLGEN